MPRVGGVPENLVLVKNGDPPLNPKGNNQYTYRRDFERSITLLLKGNLREEEVEALNLPDYILHIAESGALTRGELIAVITVYKAMQGNKDGMAEALGRLWPKTTKIELPPVEPRSQTFVPTEADQLALSQEFKGNGEDKSGVLQ